MIQAITGPVIFVTVVIGIASIGSLAKAGGLAAKALIYFFVMTVIALALGLLAGNLIAPGSGFDGQRDAAARADAKAEIGEAGPQGLVPFLTDDVLPNSFVSPFVENEILRILVLGIVMAAAISFLSDAERRKVVSVFESIGRISFGVIRLVMWLAPIGAFGGMAYTVAVFGSASLANLGLLMVTFWGTCAVFVFGVLGLVAKFSGFSILRFIRLIRDELLIIVGTSSSETVLPRLLAKLEAAGASRQSVGMVIPTGYSFNFDGTCIHLTLGIALVVGIDRIMSEGRALTNCIGNGVATMVVSKWAGERDDERFQAALRDPAAVEQATEIALRGGERRRSSTSSVDLSVQDKDKSTLDVAPPG